jgi:hypothetical protein
LARNHLRIDSQQNNTNTPATLLSVTKTTSNTLTSYFAELLGVLVGGATEIEAVELGDGFDDTVETWLTTELVTTPVETADIEDPAQYE